MSLSSTLARAVKFNPIEVRCGVGCGRAPVQHAGRLAPGRAVRLRRAPSVSWLGGRISKLHSELLRWSASELWV